MASDIPQFCFVKDVISEAELIEFERYIDKQFLLLKSHFERCIQRCINEALKLDYGKTKKTK